MILSWLLKTVHFNRYQKSDKTTFIIDADLESLIKKTDECKHIPSGFLMSIILSFKDIQYVYRGKNCFQD